MEEGQKVEEEEERWGESEDFNAKACDVSKTDVGLCSGNGPWVALLSLFSARRGGKRDRRMKEIAGVGGETGDGGS